MVGSQLLSYCNQMCFMLLPCQLWHAFQDNHTSLLSVPAVSNRLIVIVLKNDMSKLAVRNIFYNMPLERHFSSPLVLLPEFQILVEINRSNYLSYTTKLPTSINLKIETSFPLDYIHCKKKISDSPCWKGRSKSYREKEEHWTFPR